jgi:hypothetical protein
MTSILYYSNYCENCKKLISTLSKNKVKEQIHYVCIDRRVKGNDGATYVILENSQKLLLPPTVTKVPALLLLTQGHHVLFGDQIYQHLQPRENNFSSKIANAPDEPSAFSMKSIALGGVASDTFSFLDQDATSMSAKGDGGLRQMHQYATLDFADKINTPPDNYEPNTIGNQGMTMEQIQQQRNNEVPQPGPPQQNSI